MSKLANELTLIRHMIEVGYRRKHAKNHIPSLLLDENRFSSNNWDPNYKFKSNSVLQWTIEINLQKQEAEYLSPLFTKTKTNNFHRSPVSV